jgi:predicted patatin/cPLA2 family phospholipase
MLDGGITDSIPLLRAQNEGFTENNVVVLTRNRGYRKQIKGTKVPPFIYRKYPLLREAINNRSKLYNEQLDLVERLEDEGRITVIRPQRPIEVDRIEKNIDKLTALYEEGYQLADTIQFL